MNVSRTMAPLQPSALEWVIGIAIGWVIVATSLLVIGMLARIWGKKADTDHLDADQLDQPLVVTGKHD